MTQNEKDNLVIWTPENKGGHVESYFLKLNHVQEQAALWLKFTIYSPKGKPEDAVGEVWGIFFDVKKPEANVGAKETFPISSCALNPSHPDPLPQGEREKDRGKDNEFSTPTLEKGKTGDFGLKMGPSMFTNGKTRGKIKGNDGTEISWDLNFTTDKPPLHHFRFPKMYTAKIPKSKAKSPHPDSRFSGTFSVGSRTFTIQNVPGMQGHNWGSEHAHTYAWAHCNAFEGMDGVYFEGFSSKVKIGPLLTPFLSSAFLFYEGKLLRFDTPGGMLSKKISVDFNRWTFEVANKTHILKGEVGAPKEFFCGLHYYDPSGHVSYCLNSKVSNAVVQLLDRGGSLIQQFVSKNTTALEVLTKDKNHGIKMVV